MTVGTKKAALGITVSLIVFGIGLPVAYWFISMALDHAFGVRAFVNMPVSLILAATAMVIGVFWVSWSYSYLLFVGQGLPLEAFGRAFHPTSILVTTGPYAYTRNPMVIGMLFILAGVAFLRGSIPGVVLIPFLTIAVAVYLVAFEEGALLARFGPDYQEYRRNVPLLIPRLTPYIHEPSSNPS
jgi:protein-S-isoprenylcysteine O-methyltransferase Ste14